jgi:hypothetical protein
MSFRIYTLEREKTWRCATVEGGFQGTTDLRLISSKEESSAIADIDVTASMRWI